MGTTQRSKRLRWIAVAALIFAVSFAARAQQGPHLVKDINRQPDPGSSSNPRNFVAVGNVTFFTATLAGYAQSLWRTDSTRDGTVLMRNFGAAVDLDNLTDVGGVLLFTVRVYTDLPGRATNLELWKSNGTESGTVRVREITHAVYSYVTDITNLGSVAVFISTDAPRSVPVLWRTDGTEVGTAPIIPFSANLSEVVRVGGKAFFIVDGLQGGLWTTDGTAGGTSLVKSALDTFGSCSSPSPRTHAIAAVDNMVFFSATDPSNNCSLWKSDGTAEGTVLVKDLSANSPTAMLDQFTTVGNRLFFRVTDAPRQSLWTSDGSDAGTIALANIGLDLGTAVGDTLFFAGGEGQNRELWKSDGTVAGTGRVKDINLGPNPSYPSDLSNLNGILFFSACSYSCNEGICVCQGERLWKSDGTDAGTVRITEIDVSNLTSANSALFFGANDGIHGREPWISDGTRVGTMLLKDVDATTASSGPRYLTDVNGTLFFLADDGITGVELWKSDGTEVGTRLVRDINPGPNGISPPAGTLPPFAGPAPVALNSNLYFIVDDGSHGYQVWRSDGSSDGTQRVTDIPPAVSHDATRAPCCLTRSGERIFLGLDDGSHGLELWSIDGTTAALVKDINPGVPGSNLRSLTDVNGSLFFVASKGDASVGLWKSDGTDDGTPLLAEFASNVAPEHLTNVGGMVFFVSGLDLWKSDGSSGGTTRVAPGLSPQNLSDVNGTLFFAGSSPLTGVEPWKSDGSASGTMLVRDINPGSVGSYPHGFTGVNGAFVFGADDTAHGSRVWRSDGTRAGTMPIGDVRLGAALTIRGDLLFFLAFNGDSSAEFWRTDGTPAGTAKIETIWEAPTSLFQLNPVVAGSTVFFTPYDDAGETELWAASLPTHPGCTGDCNGDGSVAPDELVTDVAIALGVSEESCPGLDADGNRRVTVDELLQAVNYTLVPCQ